MAAPLDFKDRAGLIEAAALWLYREPGHPRPTIAALNNEFCLTPVEAVAAIRRWQELWREAMREAREHEQK